MRQITTCKDCKDRYLGCHDHCKRYKDKKAEQDIVETRRKMEQSLDNEFAKMTLRRKDRRNGW